MLQVESQTALRELCGMIEYLPNSPGEYREQTKEQTARRIATSQD